MDSLSGEKSVSSKETYLLRVRGLVASLSSALTDDEKKEVHHLVDHGEPAEAVRVLAWIIADGKKTVPASVIATIMELTSGLVDVADLPGNLNSFSAE
jgi:hypothetical protein